MNKELYKKYVDLRFQLRDLEEKEKSLKEEILADLQNNKVDKVETDFGAFTVCKKLSWSYSPAIKSKEEGLKIAKLKEQERGIAESSETNYLMFKEKKE